MKRNLLIFCLLISMLATFTLFNAVTAQQQGQSLSTSPATGRVAEVETYVTEIDGFVKSNAKTQRIFADVASGANANAKANWREFKSEQERTAADTGDNLNENAYVWMRDGKIIGANFTFQSPSRDWVHYVMYYFRGDGTLAKSDATLNTFNGDITVVRKDYYDNKGILLKGTTHCKDLKTQRSKPCGNLQEQPAPVYLRVNKLPFYTMLNK
ncbi:MAG: hypothetical protein H7Y30_11745 [Pyrinomonadaceae bacterium]|nr:hypothetical protein [Pyrinomonadaceae bacterium]